MTPQERLAAAVEMSEDVRALAEAGIRQHHPAYADADVVIDPDRPSLAKLVDGLAGAGLFVDLGAAVDARAS